MLLPFALLLLLLLLPHSPTCAESVAVAGVELHGIRRGAGRGGYWVWVRSNCAVCSHNYFYGTLRCGSEGALGGARAGPGAGAVSRPGKSLTSLLIENNNKNNYAYATVACPLTCHAP